MRVPRPGPELTLTIRTWAIILLLGVWMLAWVGLVYFLIGDRPPTWGYGTVPPVPGQSYYTTGPPPPKAPVPEQVPSREQPTEAQP